MRELHIAQPTREKEKLYFLLDIRMASSENALMKLHGILLSEVCCKITKGVYTYIYYPTWITTFRLLYSIAFNKDSSKINKLINKASKECTMKSKGLL